MRWLDVNFDDKYIHVQSAKVVGGVMKGTKTKSGNRLVELDDVALKVLKDQLTFRKNSGFVFNDPKLKKGWKNADAIRKKAWVPALNLTRIRYRNPYQTSPTFTQNILLAELICLSLGLVFLILVSFNGIIDLAMIKPFLK